VPTVQKQPGARAAILLVDRKAGKSFSGTIWDTEKDLQNSEAAVAGIRKDIASKAGAPVRRSRPSRSSTQRFRRPSSLVRASGLRDRFGS